MTLGFFLLCLSVPRDCKYPPMIIGIVYVGIAAPFRQLIIQLYQYSKGIIFLKQIVKLLFKIQRIFFYGDTIFWSYIIPLTELHRRRKRGGGPGGASPPPPQ